VKQSLVLVCLWAVCNVMLLAQGGRAARVVHTTEKSATHVPPQEAPAGLKNIYSNLKSKTDLYLDTVGRADEGPNSFSGGSQFAAMPFTPKSNSHVSQVRVAVQYYIGANQVNLSLYGDTNDAPGTMLAGPITVANLPNAGTCCTLAVANFSSVAVTGGTQYWVVADTPLTGTGSDFQGVWDFVAVDVPQAVNIKGGGWYGFSGLYEVAGQVLGTIP